MHSPDQQQTVVPVWERRSSYLAVVFVLLLTRVDVLVTEPLPATSDVPIYANFMLERELGRQRGVPFYEAHVRITRWRARQAAGKNLPPPVAYEEVEYPPLALTFLRLPAQSVSQLPTPQQNGKPAPAQRGWMKPPDEEWTDEYAEYYPLWMVPVDLLLFALLFPFTRRLYPTASAGARTLALVAYVVGTTALWPLLYTRLDLVLALLMTAGLFLLVSRVHYIWSFVLLAVAINFKLTPVVLAPVWVIGALPAGLGQELLRRRVLGPAALRAGVLVALTVGLFLPFYFAHGPAALDFVGYHKDRGLEVGSFYSHALTALKWFGHPSEVYFAHGSHNVRSPLAPFLIRAAPVLCAAALLAATGLLTLGLRRLSRAGGPEPASRETLAQAHPVLFVKFALLFLLLFIATNKVFSPQYVLWLVPFACLLPWNSGPHRLSHVLFLATCALTTLVFPFYYWDEVVGRTAGIGDGPPTYQGSSPAGFLLVSARNLMFLGLSATLLWSISRDVRGTSPSIR